ncbi:MAG: choice-of-anchor J domain-containing protein [Flavobacteriales bacterium]
MNYRFLLLLLFVNHLSFFAQTELLNTNFQTGIPANYTLLNLDNEAPALGMELFASGWITTTDPENPQDTVAAASSYFLNADTANRWLITPALSLGSFGNYLNWEAKSHDPSYPDDYLVLVSTTNTDPTSFTDTIGNVNEENFEWTFREVNLSEQGYNDSTIYIAFVLRGIDNYILYLDDIHVNIDDPVSTHKLTQNWLQIYPNPCTDRLQIKEIEGFTQVRLYDLFGHLILSCSQTAIDTHNLIPGTYFIEVSANGNIARQRFQKI